MTPKGTESRGPIADWLSRRVLLITAWSIENQGRVEPLAFVPRPVRSLIVRPIDAFIGWLDRHTPGGAAYWSGLELIDLDRIQAAEAAFEDAARLFERDVGRVHPWTVQSLALRAWCLVRLKRAEEAIPLYEEALEHYENSWPRRAANIQELREQLAWARDEAAG